MRSRTLSVVAFAVTATFVALATAACPNGPRSSVTPKPVSSHPIDSPSSGPPYALTVTVQAGGDCREFTDRFEIRGHGKGNPKTTLLGVATTRKRTESSPPGLIPCQFEFTVPRLPATADYYVVDRTLDRGWGPWSLATLQQKNWRVTVAITDLN